MSSKFSLFLALRYLKPKRTFVSIITLISVIGVTLGVAVLIVVISVMSGFEEKIMETVLGFEPHVIVETNGEIYLPFPDERPPDMIEDLDIDTGEVILTENPLSEKNLSQEERDYREEMRALRKRGLWENVKERLEAEDLVVEAAPYIEGQVLMKVTDPEGQTRQLAPIMRALMPDDDSYQVRKIRELMKTVEPLPGQENILNLEQPNVVMSVEKARSLGVGVGDTVTIVSPRNIETLLNELLPIVEDKESSGDELRQRFDEITEGYVDKDLVITGLFDSLTYKEHVIVRMTDGQDLYGFGPNDFHGLAIHTTDAYRAAELEAAILDKGLLTPNWHSQTWMKKHQLFFEQIRNERAMMYFVLFFIVIVAAFSIMNTMITVTVQKRKEIGVMKALGAREKQIVWVFLAQGMVVGVIGTLVGLAAGNLVIEFREPLRQGLKAAFGMNIFPEGLYGVAEIPERRRLLDMGIICVGAFVLCTLAALVPAWFAARLDPAKALRE